MRTVYRSSTILQNFDLTTDRSSRALIVSVGTHFPTQGDSIIARSKAHICSQVHICMYPPVKIFSFDPKNICFDSKHKYFSGDLSDISAITATLVSTTDSVGVKSGAAVGWEKLLASPVIVNFLVFKQEC